MLLEGREWFMGGFLGSFVVFVGCVLDGFLLCFCYSLWCGWWWFCLGFVVCVG